MNTNKMTLGLDIGIGSCGWAVINDDLGRIEDLGVRIYTSGEEGATKSNDRASQQARMYRSRKRLNKRNKQRKVALKKALDSMNFIEKEKVDELFLNHKNNNNVIELRYNALDRVVSKVDIVSILINMANYRGYKDFYGESDDKKDSKLDESVNLVKSLFDRRKYRTIGEMIYLDDAFKTGTQFKNYRNNDGYKYLFSREDLIYETKLILQSQADYYEELTQDFIDEILGIIFSQRDFEDGPGPKKAEQVANLSKYNSGQRKYSGFNEMIGKCTYFPNENKGTRNSFVYDVYAMVNDLSTVRFFYENSGEECLEYKKLLNILIEEVVKGKGVCKIATFKKILKKENIEMEDRQKREQFGAYKFIKFVLNDEIFDSKTQELLIGDLLNDKFMQDESLSNKLGELITQYITPAKRARAVKELLPEIDADRLRSISITKVGSVANLSNKYMKLAINTFVDGVKYGIFQANFIKDMVEVDEEEIYVKDGKLLPIKDEDLLRNPVVYKTISETRKVINAVIKKYNITSINIEMAREIGKSFEQRKEYQKIQLNNEKDRKDAETRLLDLLNTYGYPLNITTKMMEKYVLWESQNHKCLYTNVDIPFSSIALTDNSVQVDHIIPQSIVLDDTLNNKVLVYTNANSSKGNRLPLQCMGEEGFISEEEYKALIKDIRGKLSPKKVRYLTLEKLDDEVVSGFVSRNINDTRYITRYITNYLKKAVKQMDKEIAINALNGSVTSRFRKKWLNQYTDKGIIPSVYSLDEKGRDLHYYHHSIDAVIIANLEPKYIVLANVYDTVASLKKDKYLSAEEKNREINKTIDNAVKSLSKYRGMSEEFIRNCINKTYVPSKCKNLMEQVETLVPLEFTFKGNFTPYSYKHDVLSYKKLCYVKSELKKAVENNEKIDSIMEAASEILKSLRLNDGMSSQELTDLDVTKLEPKLVDYLEDIRAYTEDEYKERLEKVFGTEFANKMKYPYVSFRINRKYRGNYLQSDVPVSFKDIQKEYKDYHFETIDDFIKFTNSLEGLKSPFYVRKIGKYGDKDNYTIYKCGYYCTEVFINAEGKADLRGIRYPDLKKKDGKLYLLKELPEGCEHIMYLFSNEYIEVRDKKGRLKNNGFGAYRSAENVNQQSIKIRLFSNKNLKGKDKKIKIDFNMKKYEVDILGKLQGEIKCGDQLLFMKEKK